MGLFSAHRGGFRPAGFRSPIRIHSEISIVATARQVAALPAVLPTLITAGLRRGALTAGRAARALGTGATAATNDARVVGVLLLVAASALAFEMAQSFR